MASGNNPPLPTFPSGSGLGGKSVATMTCDFALLTPFMTTFFGGPLPITANAEFPVRTGAIANIGGGTYVPPPGAPTASFTFVGVNGGTVDGAGDVTGTEGVTVSVADASTLAETWSWDWGDGTPLATIRPRHLPTPSTMSVPIRCASQCRTRPARPPRLEPSR